jgi:hypothetical protein
MMRNRFTVRRALLLAAFLLAPVGLVAGAVPASASISPGPAPVPLPGVCTTVPEVKTAELVKTVDGPAILITGIKTHADSRLQLDAEDVVFVQQPDYWNYFVNECGGTGPVVKTPFTEVFRVPTAPVGKFGIAIHGILIDLFPHVLADA